MKYSLVVMAILVLVSCAAAAGELPASDQIATGEGPLVVHAIEHATFVMEWNGKTIAVDPVGGAGAFTSFPKADLILITHTHGDHLSLDTVASLVKESTAIVAPASVAGAFPEDYDTRISVVANGESTQWDGLVIEAVAMYNLDPEKQKFHPKGVGNGYVITLGGKRIYIAGDTEDIPEMRSLENVEAAFLCMNLPYTMEVDAAADAVLEFQPKIVYPYHFRGKGGMSDLDRFRSLVAQNPSIEVRLLKWY